MYLQLVVLPLNIRARFLERRDQIGIDGAEGGYPSLP